MLDEAKNDDDDRAFTISSIKAKLDDALNLYPFLQAVLLRAKESQEHTKWLSRRRKLQRPGAKEIGKTVKALKECGNKTYLQQILCVAKCKVVIYYVVRHWMKTDKRSKRLRDDEEAIKRFAKMFGKVKQSKSVTNYDQLINGLGM